MTKDQNEKPIAFVLDMGCTGLGIARSLGRAGVPVVGVDFIPNFSGLSSRYCRPVFSPDPLMFPEGTLKVLLGEGKKLAERGVIFPRRTPVSCLSLDFGTNYQIIFVLRFHLNKS